MASPQLYAAVLAAGEGRRFGATKQLADIEGQPMAAVTLANAEACCGDRVILVTGYEAGAIFLACRPQQGFVVRNARYRSGMSSSIAVAIDTAGDVADALMIVLADQPFVTSEDLSLLVREWRRQPESIVAAEFKNAIGPPAIFPRAHFSALRALDGDSGARRVIEESGCVRVRLPNAAFDVDCRQDLERA